MLIAILGDVHANREALDAVLADAESRGVGKYLQVGDLVGYGPDPAYAIDLLRSIEAEFCRGNHDAAVVGTLSLEHFNPFARQSIEWTKDRLEPEALAFLEALPLIRELGEWNLTLVHGSLYQPGDFDYVRSLSSAALSLEKQSAALCLVGHTHQPCLFTRRGAEKAEYRPEFEEEGFFRLSRGEQALVNVGSVGQPRDEDPRTGYVILDSQDGELELIRLPYEIEGVQEKIRRAGLPEVLADRLSFGL